MASLGKPELPNRKDEKLVSMAKKINPKNLWKGADMKNDKLDYYGPKPGHLKPKKK